MAAESRSPEDLGEEERERIRRAHHRLRKASQEMESLTAPGTLRGRWEPVPAPPEVMETVRAELARAWRDLWVVHNEVLGWELPED